MLPPIHADLNHHSSTAEPSGTEQPDIADSNAAHSDMASPDAAYSRVDLGVLPQTAVPYLDVLGEETEAHYLTHPRSIETPMEDLTDMETLIQSPTNVPMQPVSFPVETRSVAVNEAVTAIEAERPVRLSLLPNLAVAPAPVPEEVQEKIQEEVQEEDHALEAQDLIHRGDDYLMQGQTAEAIAHYRRALELMPSLVDAHQGLAEALSQQGNLEEAAIHYQKALELIPLPSEAIAEEVQEQALEEITDQNTAQPPGQTAGRTEASSALQPAHAETAVETSRSSAKPESVNPLEELPWYEQGAFFLQQGKVLCDRQKWKEAIEACEKAVELLGPKTAQAYLLLGQALQAEKRLDEAEQSYTRSRSLEPGLAEVHARLGSLYAEQQRLTDSMAAYQQAIEIDPNFAGAYLKLGEVWRRLGDQAQAADSLYQAYQLEPKWATAKEHLSLGNLLMKQGKLDPAIWCYQQAIESSPTAPDAYHNLAMTLSKQGKWAEALDYEKQAVERAPQDARLRVGLAKILMRLERWQDALVCYQQVTELKSDHAQLQDALVQMERCQRAVLAQSYGKMADNLAQQQQWQEAARLYQMAIERNPQNAVFQAGMGKVLVALQQWNEAITYYEQAVAIDPQKREYRTALAEVLLRLKRFEDAAQCYYTLANPKQAAQPTVQKATVQKTVNAASRAIDPEPTRPPQATRQSETKSDFSFKLF